MASLTIIVPEVWPPFLHVTWVLDYWTPVHGDRPFEIAHIDHTELDIELASSRTGHNLGRPWGTFMIDAFSRRILAIYISYDPPSYRSCMMVIRECVRKWNRLPQNVVLDGGKEFHGIYFETLNAFFEITPKTRGAAQARQGSLIERFFKTTNEEFIHNLLGNTKIMKNVRQVTKAVNPKEHAVWTLFEFYGALREFVYEVYDTNHHDTLGQSPRELFTQRILTTGQRAFKMLSYNELFKLLTLPSPRREVGKVHPGKGIQINHIYYWNSAFSNPDVESKTVDRRNDPFNVGVAYAYANKTWVKCISELNHIFEGRTEAEILSLSHDLKMQLRHNKQDEDITAKKLAEFLLRQDDTEQALLQRLKIAESNQIRALINNIAESNQIRALINNDATSANKPLVAAEHGEPATEDAKTDPVDPDSLPTYGEYKL